MAEAGWYPDQRNPGSRALLGRAVLDGATRPVGGAAPAPQGPPAPRAAGSAGPQRRRRPGLGPVGAGDARQPGVPRPGPATRAARPAAGQPQVEPGQSDTTRIERQPGLPAGPGRPGPARFREPAGSGTAGSGSAGSGSAGIRRTGLRARTGYGSQGYGSSGLRGSRVTRRGTAAPGYAPGAPGAPSPARSRRKPLIIGGIAVVVLLAAGLVTWLVLAEQLTVAHLPGQGHQRRRPAC